MPTAVADQGAAGAEARPLALRLAVLGAGQTGKSSLTQLICAYSDRLVRSAGCSPSAALTGRTSAVQPVCGTALPALKTTTLTYGAPVAAQVRVFEIPDDAVERRSGEWRTFLGSLQAAVVAYSVTDAASFAPVAELLDELRTARGGNSLPAAILAATHADVPLVRGADARAVEARIARRLALRFHADFIELDVPAAAAETHTPPLVTLLSQHVGRRSPPRAAHRRSVFHTLRVALGGGPASAPAPPAECKSAGSPDLGDHETSAIVLDREMLSRIAGPQPRRVSHASVASSQVSRAESDAASSAVSGGALSGFSVAELVERLTAAQTSDLEFVSVFLLIFRKFMTPAELLDRLIERFDSGDAADDEAAAADSAALNPVQVRVCNVLVLWMQRHFGDFSSEHVRFTMHVFVGTLASRPEFALLWQRLTDLLYRPVPGHPRRQGWDWHSLTSAEDEATRREYDLQQRRGDEVSVPLDGRGTVPRYFDRRQSCGLWNGYERGVQFATVGSPPASGQTSPIVIPVGLPPLAASPAPTARTAASSPVLSSAATLTTLRTPDESLAPTRTPTPAPVPPKTGLVGALLALGPLGMNEHAATADELLANETRELLLERPVAETAEQLCLLEFDIFRQIDARDVLQHIWSKREKGRHAPAVTASIAHFNFISGWVTTTVISQRKSKQRSRVLQQFVEIARAVRRLNNYNTLMAILAGVNSAPILRLRRARKTPLDKRGANAAAYHELEKLMGSERSFAHYRNDLRRSEAPCVPYLGVFLRDLLYIDEANRDFKSDGTVNLPKFLLIGDIIMMIQSFQLRPYPFFRDEAFLARLLGVRVLDDDAAYQRSLEIEPRAVSLRRR